MTENMSIGEIPLPHEHVVEDVYSTLEAIEQYFRDKLVGGDGESLSASVKKADFGVRVRQLRDTLGLSQAEFASRYGLDLSTLRGWEQGRRMPDKANRTLIEAIEVSPGLMANIIAKTQARSEVFANL
ncbi:DNA-binding protein [Rhodomicrobium udaipurense JA643]|nr:helix-turn-helix domain-containing protein [Rhodomicrobium udaipurense]KAI95355.1 DNA-binding protein [Rhodomicrobium udaipurense JA643]